VNYETIQMIESFIQEQGNPKKQQIARNLVVDNNYQISKLFLYGDYNLYIQNKNTGEIYKFSSLIDSMCNCQ